MRQILACFFLAAASAAAAPALRAQNLVLNPSFEAGNFVNDGSGFEVLNAGDTSISNWSIVVDDIAWGITPNSDDIIAHGGTHFLDLEGPGLYAVPYGGVSQTVPTISGQTYHFSFFLGTQQSHRNDTGPISVSATAGSLTQSFTFNPVGTSNTQWGEFGFDFTATGNSTPISIVGTYTNDGAYIGLDDVSVILVPEPATVVFLLGGVLGVGVLRRARRQR